MILLIYFHLFQDGRYQMVGEDGSLLVTQVTHQDSYTTFTCRVRDKLANRELASHSPAKITTLGKEKNVIS